MSPQAHCEACASASVRLHVSESSPLVDYFRCSHCGAVWTEPKPGFLGRRTMITYPANPKDEPA